VSAFLPLGPCGQGAFGIIQLGIVGKTALSTCVAPEFATIIYYVDVIVGLLLWSLGGWWLIIAVSIIVMKMRHLPFNMGWWAFTFPLGVYTSATISLGKVFELKFFNVYATFCVVALFLLWLIVAIRLIVSIVRREAFVAPCLSNVHLGAESDHVEMNELHTTAVNCGREGTQMKGKISA